MDKKISTTERFHIFILLMLSGGFMGAYSYYLKGGVFANAETANLLLLSLNLANGNWNAAFSVLIPIATFFLGTFFSELLSSRIKHRWPPILISCEILLLAVLSLLPEETPFTLYHVSIALISSMQYNTFRQARGVPLSTLFCTAHLRGGASSLYHALAEKNSASLQKFYYHTGLIATFISGAVLCALTSRILSTHTLILSVLPLCFVLFEILRKKD